MADLETLRARANSLAAARAGPMPVSMAATAPRMVRRMARPFSAFEPADLGKAMLLTLQLQAAAKAAGGPETDQLAAALEVAEEAATSGEDPSLVSHALQLFNAHSSTGRLLRLERPIELASGRLVAFDTSAANRPLNAEEALALWREDPLANDHHIHWHVVYPFRGLVRETASPGAIARFQAANGDTDQLSEADLNDLFRYQDRHGEMFVYMHQQMLARYGAERLALGLTPLVALDAELGGAPIAEGYDVDATLEPGVDGGARFFDRPPGAQIDPDAAAYLSGVRGNLQAAIQAGALTTVGGGAVAIDRDNLGAVMEAALRIFRSGADPDYYADFHNTGHVIISSLSTGQAGGVMRDPTHAIRDPVFWRWHRVIDDLSYSWQQTQPSLDFADRPPITLRKGADAFSSPDLVMLSADQIPADAAGRAEVERRLTDSWDAVAGDIADGGSPLGLLDTLTTYLRTASIQMPDGSQRDIWHVSHDPFAYAVRLENTGASDAPVTLRVFLAPEAQADDRRAWMELDKVTTTVPAAGRKLVLRLGSESEVVKKPVDLGPDSYVPAIQMDAARCACGWPYPLLLPRGTTQGLGYVLMVCVTDAAIDGFASTHACGSVSFCGAQDADYPDARDMGYPFHRDWGQSVTAMLADQTEPCLAARRLTLKHRDPGP